MGRISDNSKGLAAAAPRLIAGLVALAALMFLFLGLRGRNTAELGPSQSVTALSQVFEVDAKYRSMMGPYDEQELRLGAADSQELLWITGYRAVMVGADGESPMPQEFMCHSNLDIDPIAHGRALGQEVAAFSPRLFTLSQGQQEVHFPPGFGIPVLASEPLDLTTQVLNHNFEDERFEVRHKVTVEFSRERDAPGSMKALFPVGAYGLAHLGEGLAHFGVQVPDEGAHGPGCLPGDNASEHSYEDDQGRLFTGHWQVPPGTQVNRTLVTQLMRLPYDTTIHYIAVHLHPFAESLALVDLETGETLFESRAENFEGRIGLAKVDAFSSAEGIPVYKHREYELVSTYVNTTEEVQDSMAVMYLYLADREFGSSRFAS